MSSDWQKAKDIFSAALELQGEARQKYVDEACADDADLHDEVDSLLSSLQDAGGFLDERESPTRIESTRFSPGDQVGQYFIVSHLGSGGMGEVYLARDPRLDRIVVLKLLADVLRLDESARKRFLHEARMASAVEHPNVCTIYEIGRHDDLDVIVMQYIDGRSLKEELAAGRMETGRIIDIAEQIANGLAAAHEVGIIHRDLKPANIMITPKDRVVILDFGLAKPAEKSGKTQLTQSGMIIGTPAYMSPEQVRSRTLDQRSDIFSFGTVLYEMTTGRTAFSDKDKGTVEILHAVVYDEPEPIDAEGDTVREAIGDIIDRCLKKDPDDRYATVEEMGSDLAAAADPNSTRALRAGTAPARPPHTLTAKGRRRYGRLLAVAAGAALLVAGAFFGFRQFSKAEQVSSSPRAIAVLPLRNLTGDPSNDYLSDGITESVIDSLSKVGDLRVVPRATSFRYREETLDPVAIGKQLGIDGVLEGSMQKEGDALRIAIRMISASDGSVLWSNSDFRGAVRDIFALQDQLAQGITAKLQVPSTASTPNRTDPEAYRLYLEGRFYWNQLTKAGLEKSIEYYQLAIQKDPNFALAYVGLADANVVLGMDFVEPREAFSKAKAAATRAIELDDSLAAAHISMGSVKLFLDWDWQGARAEAARARQLSRNFDSAMEINTQYGENHHFYCGFLEAVGEADLAIDEIRKARQLDPLSSILTYELGLSYYVERKYPDALALADELARFGSDGSLYALQLRAQVLEQEGRFDEAIAALTKARENLGDAPLLLSELGYSYAKGGRAREADSIIAGLQKRSAGEFIDPYYIAVIYLGLGKKTEALNWLDKAAAAHSIYITYLNIEPKFDDIKNEDRFNDLRRRVGLA